MTSVNPLVSVLTGLARNPPPIWFMRQAGRYLPEYREVRSRAGGFVELCLDPQLAAEVTLQPVRRFGLDAAIIFSDILIVPYALGVKLWFEEGEGPRLEAVDDLQSLRKMRGELDRGVVERVYEALRVAREALAGEALIGFCGAPWTVATYLIAGEGGDQQAAAMRLMAENEELFGRIMDRLAEATSEHLVGQLRAGADVVQIFDTWAGVLSGELFERWCVAPIARIVSKVRAAEPGARVIVFARGATLGGIGRVIEACDVDAISLDAGINRKDVRERVGMRCALQGNLAPEILLSGGAELDREVDEILEDWRGTRHIFNLGHGILKETPIAHVEQMIRRVRGL